MAGRRGAMRDPHSAGVQRECDLTGIYTWLYLLNFTRDGMREAAFAASHGTCGCSSQTRTSYCSELLQRMRHLLVRFECRKRRGSELLQFGRHLRLL